MLAAGYAIFGCGFAITSDIALTYLTDCYPDVSEHSLLTIPFPYYILANTYFQYTQNLGDALIVVVFVRNGISVLVMFVYTPWIRGLGIQNTFICVAMISLAMMIMPTLLHIWG